MANKRDVELVIRAKNEATKAVEAVSEALKALVGDQDALAKSAQKTDGLLGKLATEFNTLQKQVQGLKALGSVAAEFDKASAAIGRLEKEAARLSEESNKVTRDLAAAAEQTTRLKAEADAAAVALANQKRAAAEARTANSDLSKQVRAAETALARLEKQIGKGGASDELRAQYDRQKEALAQLKVQQEQSAAAHTRQQAALKAAGAGYRELQGQVRASIDNEARLRTTAEGLAGALTRQQEATARARTEMAGISSVGSQASSALGGVAVSQDAVAAASKKAAEDLEKVRAALDRQKSAASSAQQAAAGPAAQATAAYRAQAQAVRDAETAWRSAQQQATALGRSIATAAAPTREMQTAFVLAKEAAAQTRAEYLAQVQALQQMRGTTATTVSQLVASQRQVTVASRESGQALQLTATGARELGRQSAAAAPPLREMGNAMGQAASQGTGLRGAFGGIYGESRKAMSILQRFRGEVLGLATSFLGLQAGIRGAGGVIDAYRTLEAAQSRLGAVFSQDQAKINETLDWLRQQAGRLGITFSQLSDEYSKFAVATQAANFSTDATRKVFLSVAEAGRVNKLSFEQMRGVFLALQQMISKGKVQSEELRRQLGDRLPGAFNIMADALGVTTARLDEMLKKGEVIADQTTLLRFADQLDKRFGSQLPAALRTVTTEIGRFFNNLFQGQLLVAEGGFIKSLQTALQNLNAFFQSREGRDFFLALGAALGKFVDVLVLVPQHFDLIKVAIAAIIGLRFGQALTGMFAQFRAGTGELTLFGQQMVAARANVIAFEASSRTAWTSTIASLTAARASGGLLTGTFVALRTTAVGLVGSITALAAALTVANARTVATTASMGLLSGAMVVMRGVATALVGVVRTIFLALGGWVGILITLATLVGGHFLAKWLTEVDDGTRTLDEHRRIVDAVAAAYTNAKDKNAEWAKTIKGVSVDQANANFRAMTVELEKSRKAVSELAGALKTFTDSDEGRKVAALGTQFEHSNISAGEFRKGLEEVYKATKNDRLREYLEALLKAARAAEDAEKKQGEAAVAAKALGSNVAQVNEVAAKTKITVNDLAHGINDLSGALLSSSTNADKFAESIEKLKEKIPGLAKEVKAAKELRELSDNFLNAFFSASNFDQIRQAQRLFSTAQTAVGDRQETEFAKSLTQATGDLKGIIERIIKIESNGNPTARATTSSAVGLGQFIESTWLRLFDKVFPELAELNNTQKLALRNNEEASRKMLTELTKMNAAQLVRAGISPTAANLYLAHFLGASGAIKMILANPKELAKDIAGESAARANPSVLGNGKTVQDVLDFALRKTGGGAELLASGLTKAEEAQRKLNEGARELADRTRDSVEAVRHKNVELDREAFIQQKVNEALKLERKHRDDGAKLTQDQINLIRQQAGALFDAQQAAKKEQTDKERARETLREIVGLEQQRATAIKEARLTQDPERFEELKAKVDELTAKLKAAVPEARALAAALGDEKMIATLDKVSLRVDTLKVQIVSAKQVNDAFADGFSNAFKSMAENIADAIRGAKSWKEALGGVRDAFLKFAADFLIQIAQMILKAAILRLLMNIGFGNFLSGGINALFAHSGAVVGKSGGRTKKIGADAFANAMKYHGGGLPGLKSNEVPAVLKKNEEVLSETDPRNVLNGGLAPQGGPTQVKIVNTFDPGDFLSEALGSAPGEKSILNFIRNNKSAVNAALA